MHLLENKKSFGAMPKTVDYSMTNNRQIHNVMLNNCEDKGYVYVSMTRPSSYLAGHHSISKGRLC